MSLPEAISEGEISHVGHHELLHVRYNLGAPVFDHGALTGLADDDHPQYLTPAEADALYEALGAVATHAAGADPHTGYRLESADHSHQSTGLQAGKIDHGAALNGLGDDDHTQYHNAARHASVDAADHSSGAAADGTVLTADGAGGAAWEALPPGGPTYVYKTADETVTTSTTLQDDDHLSFSAAANGIYAFEALLLWHQSNASLGGLKWQWVTPDGSYDILADYWHPASGVVTYIEAIESTTTNISPPANTITHMVKFRGVLRLGGAGGTFKLQWAQNSANNSTIMETGSWFSYKKLN